MVGNPIVGPNFRPFSVQSFKQSRQYFHTVSLIDCLALWDEFKINNTFNIEESDEHCLHL